MLPRFSLHDHPDVLVADVMLLSEGIQGCVSESVQTPDFSNRRLSQARCAASFTPYPRFRVGVRPMPITACPQFWDPVTPVVAAGLDAPILSGEIHVLLWCSERQVAGIHTISIPATDTVVAYKQPVRVGCHKPCMRNDMGAYSLTVQPECAVPLSLPSRPDEAVVKVTRNNDLDPEPMKVNQWHMSRPRIGPRPCDLNRKRGIIRLHCDVPLTRNRGAGPERLDHAAGPSRCENYTRYQIREAA